MGFRSADDRFLSSALVLMPMLPNAHTGTKYGIPFPVLVRPSFGVRGANLPALLRALVACGWFGIQTRYSNAVFKRGSATRPIANLPPRTHSNPIWGSGPNLGNPGAYFNGLKASRGKESNCWYASATNTAAICALFVMSA